MNPATIFASDATTAGHPTPLIRLGSHGQWEPLAEVAKAKLAQAGVFLLEETKAGTQAGARAWWEIARCAPTGVGRFSSRTFAWVRDVRGTERMESHYGVLRKFTADEAATSKIAVKQSGRCEKYERKHNWRIARRSLMAGIPLAALISGNYHWHEILPWYSEFASGAGEAFFSTTLFGLMGNPNAAESVRRVVGRNRINEEALRKALRNLGISALRKDLELERPDTRIGHFVRDKNRNTITATVELAQGIDAGDVMLRRKRIAANLRKSEAQIILTEGQNGAHEIVITIHLSDPSKRPIEGWPLTGSSSVNIFDPIPLGVDSQGEPVTYSFFESNLFIAGKSRSGKSVTMQLLASTVLLDPRVQLMVWNGKKAPTFGFIKDECAEYFSGAAAVDDELCNNGLALINWLNNECARRGDILEREGDEKVTNDNAHIEGLHPLVVFMDEISFLFTNRSMGKDALREAKKLANQCLAYGIMLVCATQTFDGDAVPWGFVSLFQKKLAHQLAWDSDNQGMFGRDYAARGIDGTRIRTQGEAIFDGEEDLHRTLRIYFIDDQKRKEVVQRRRELCAGQVWKPSIIPVVNHVPVDVHRSGHAGRNLLADIMATRKGSEAGVWLEELGERLSEVSQDWKNVDRTALRETLKSIGVAPRSIRKFDDTVGKKRSPDGYHYELDILPALEGKVAA